MMIIGGVTISYSIIFSLHFLLSLAAAALVLQSTTKKRKTMEGLDKESYGIKKQRQDEVNKTIQLEKQWKYQKSM